MKRGTLAIIIFPLMAWCVFSWNRQPVSHVNGVCNISDITEDSVDLYPEPLFPDSATIAKRNASYLQLMERVNAQASAIKTRYATANDSVRSLLEAEANDLLFHSLTDSAGVFDHWMGTAWDFNGITTEPLKDAIACGYFVSTPLQQLGFNLNRYRLAQQYSHSIVNSLCATGSIKKYNDIEKVLQRVKSKADQLYVVGLDYHVGFLANIKGEAWFIHSDFYTVQVVKEKAADSPALNSSQLFVLGNLLGDNHVLVQKWLKGTVVEVVP